MQKYNILNFKGKIFKWKYKIIEILLGKQFKRNKCINNKYNI